MIELGAVFAVSGLVVSMLLMVYRAYMNDRYANESYEKLRMINSSLSLYVNDERQRRLPCPADPRIPTHDPNAGREIPEVSCQLLRSNAGIGTCHDGVCSVEGFRDMDGDGQLDPVLIGALPFRALRDSGSFHSATQADALDPWGFQFTYAVSGRLTARATYNASHGVIDVRTEPLPSAPSGIDLLDPPQSSQYVVVAHGKNHLGAYTAQGLQPFPCVAGTQDADNCDGDGSFTFGLYRESGGSSYFDDVLVYNSFTLSTLWDFVGTSRDIHNRNPGNVGIGTGTPTAMLEVVGDARSPFARASRICGVDGSGCFSPDVLGASAASGESMYCPPATTPGHVSVMKRIVRDPVLNRPVAECEEVPLIAPTLGFTCPAGTYIRSFLAEGTPQCGGL